MFGFSWGEIGIIMAVALVAIGPKDLPVAIRTVTGLLKKARGMASEFQGHVDDMMREANLSDVMKDVKDLKRFDLKSAAAKTFDPDGSLRATAKSVQDAASGVASAATAYKPPGAVDEEPPDAPRFIPPDAARKSAVPPFIPPGPRRWGF